MSCFIFFSMSLINFSPPYHKCNSFLVFLLFSHCVLLNEMKIGFLFQKKERINSLSLRSLYSFFSFPRLGLRWNEERIEDISTSSYFNISINIYFDRNCLCCWNLLLSSYSINIKICLSSFNWAINSFTKPKYTVPFQPYYLKPAVY